ncbi:MAG: hypothetical protein ABI068_13515 [Ktedonobacterales bacterium]
MANYRQLTLLGLLLDHPMYGQQVYEVIEQHHHLFAEHLKKPTIYYQLERLTAEGYLTLRRETVEAPGTGLAHDELAPREREVYYITEQGQVYFRTLLRQTLGEHAPQLSDLDASLFFLHYLAPHEAHVLLQERYEQVARDRENIAHHLHGLHATRVDDQAHRLVADHQLALLDAELNWLARTLMTLR